MVLELVHVIEDEHEGLGPSRQRRDQTREPARPQRVPGATEGLEHRGPDRRDGVQRLGDVRQKDDGIVVAVVERDPGEFATVVCRPLSEKRCLAVAWGCDDADDSTAALTGEAADERGTLDDARPWRWHVEFGAERLERSHISRPGRFLSRSFGDVSWRRHCFLRSDPRHNRRHNTYRRQICRSRDAAQVMAVGATGAGSRAAFAAAICSRRAFVSSCTKI